MAVLLMRPVAHGRPGTEVIPDGWSDVHRPVMAGTRTSACTIRHPGGTKGTFDTATGRTPVTANAPHYDDTARIQTLSATEQARVVAEEDVSTVGYLVAVAWDTSAETRVNDLVHVVDAGPDGDPTLTGRDLVVRSIERGSLTWERDLYCTDVD